MLVNLLCLAGFLYKKNNFIFYINTSISLLYENNSQETQTTMSFFNTIMVNKK